MAAAEWKTVGILGEMPKASGDVVKVEQKSFKSKTYISIRQYYQDRKTDEYMPGKQGISFTAEEFEQLRELFNSLKLIEESEA